MGSGGSYLTFTIGATSYSVCRTFKGNTCFKCPSAASSRCDEYAMCAVDAGNPDSSIWISQVVVNLTCPSAGGGAGEE